MNSRQTDCFEMNFFFWKIFGLWPGRTSNIYYKYFSITYLFITLVMYNGILTVNLYYTPTKIDVLLREVLFYFNEIAISAKVITVLYLRKTILEVLDILDCEDFVEDNEARLIILKDVTKYKKGWKIYAFFLNFSYFSEVIVPLISHIIWDTHLHLPISNYYFLNNEIRDHYFSFWFVYQASCMYGHMMYNVNMDSFIAGLIFFIITSVKVLQYNLEKINSSGPRLEREPEYNETSQYLKLKKCLKHYEHILRLRTKVQRIISIPSFVQLGITGAIICVALCGLLTPSASDIHLFLVTYLIGMTSRIFVPTWLGTQLTQKSPDLVFAAYNSQWITGTKTFKRDIIIFMVLANVPITLTGLKIIPMALRTFISILKNAYSLFTLVRYVQNHQ